VNTEWHDLLKNYPEANFLQSPEWAEVYKRTGDEPIFHTDEVGSIALCIIKSARRGRYMEIPGGPLLDWTKHEQAKDFIDGLVTLAREHSCVFIRVRPQIYNTPENLRLFADLGFRPAPMHLHAENTVIIDLTKSEDELLAEMRRQTRYEVRKAEKLEIKVAHENSEKNFDTFYTLQQQTATRQGFVIPSRDFLMAEREAFKDKARLYHAYNGEDLLAMGFVVISGEEANYLEAASTDKGRDLPGAYALQWQVIRDMKTFGIKRYNLFGIAPSDQPNHRYAGVTTFKTGFGGELVNYLPAHDIVIDRAKYLVGFTIETVRRKRRKL
jgi:lipid II:glycine glycyltransferase (peptidoglycan interpeptide bridge formation enzyme)